MGKKLIPGGETQVSELGKLREEEVGHLWGEM